MVNKDDPMYKALRCAELFNEDLFNLLKMEDKCFNDWAFCAEQRIKEEMSRRIETGMITPIKYLKWTAIGCDGWSHGIEEVPF
jgi:hypothetical protein